MFKHVCKIVLFAHMLSLTPIHAEDTDPFYGQKGYTLLKDSWVFSPDKAKEVRNKLIDLESAQKNIESYKTSLELEKQMQAIQDKKILLLSEQNDSLAKNLQAERTVSGLEKFGYFVLGIAATVLAGFAIKKAGE